MGWLPTGPKSLSKKASFSPKAPALTPGCVAPAGFRMNRPGQNQVQTSDLRLHPPITARSGCRDPES